MCLWSLTGCLWLISLNTLTLIWIKVSVNSAAVLYHQTLNTVKCIYTVIKHRQPSDVTTCWTHPGCICGFIYVTDTDIYFLRLLKCNKCWNQTFTAFFFFFVPTHQSVCRNTSPWKEAFPKMRWFTSLPPGEHIVPSICFSSITEFNFN